MQQAVTLTRIGRKLRELFEGRPDRGNANLRARRPRSQRA
uniref:ORF16 protein n=1 Tax=Psittacine aviadenovirus B TaxID=2169709 RepID=A0AB38ZPC7_9ADEN